MREIKYLLRFASNNFFSPAPHTIAQHAEPSNQQAREQTQARDRREKPEPTPTKERAQNQSRLARTTRWTFLITGDSFQLLRLGRRILGLVSGRKSSPSCSRTISISTDVSRCRLTLLQIMKMITWREAREDLRRRKEEIKRHNFFFFW